MDPLLLAAWLMEIDKVGDLTDGVAGIRHLFPGVSLLLDDLLLVAPRISFCLRAVLLIGCNDVLA